MYQPSSIFTENKYYIVSLSQKAHIIQFFIQNKQGVKVIHFLKSTTFLSRMGAT